MPGKLYTLALMLLDIGRGVKVYMRNRDFLILGCTASGKGKLAFEMARRLGGEILSIDSMKVYRRMNIGTAKPGPDRLEAICHHLIDVVEPYEEFSMGKYLELADQAIQNIHLRQRPIIAVGGTAMYIRGLIEGIFDGPPADPVLRENLQNQAAKKGLSSLYARLQTADPAASEKIHPNDAKRIIRALEVYEITGRPISSFQVQFGSRKYRNEWTMIGIRREKTQANHRINLRVKKMIELGLVEEVRSLLESPKGLSPQASQAVGYAEILDYFNSKCSLDDAIERIKINSRHLAKNQRTWFRQFADVHWFDVDSQETAENLTDRVLDYFQSGRA